MVLESRSVDHHHRWLQVLRQVYFMFVCSAESANCRYRDSVTNVGATKTKLGRRVVGTKMQVESEDGCGMSTNTHPVSRLLGTVLPYTPVASRLV